MGEGLLVTDTEGTVILVNPAFCLFFGVDGEPTGQPLIDITRHPALHETFGIVLSTGNEYVAELTLAGEGEKTLLTHWVPLLEDGKTAGVVAVFHDISDQKRLERVRKDFVANVSHELRTPVTVIKGYAETLLNGALTSDPVASERFVTIIKSHAERLATLIGDLLTLSELESAEYSLQLSPVPLTELVRHCLVLVEKRATDKGITLDASLVVDVSVSADRGRLEQVMVNLLDNAVKYTPAGGRVTVSATEDAGMIKVSVADTGQGIPPQSLPRIFERFYRVDVGRSRDEGGTGLGLAIVKHIVQLHGGAIGVDSVPGKGTIFNFTIKQS
jgi:two-component system phosphate regulon sensor histidine kinase PhoR